MNETTRQGIEAFQAGDKIGARQLFITAARQFPNDADAWLWLSAAVDRDQERLDCLRQVLRIDPTNQAAQKGMQVLMARAEKAAPPPAVEAAPAATIISTEEQQPQPVDTIPQNPKIEETQNPVGIQPVETPHAETPHSASYAMRSMFDDADPGERIFTARPSLAPLLILTWIMIFLVWLLQAVIPENSAAKLTLTLLNCGVLAILIIYIAIKLSASRYELTTKIISAPIQNKRRSIPLRQIYHVSKEQNWLQKILRIADLRLEGAVNGVLTTFRLRNLPDFEKRYNEIQAQRQGAE